MDRKHQGPGRLSNLINQMVVLACLEEQPDVTFVDVNFSEVVRKVAGNFKSVIEKAGKKHDQAVKISMLRQLKKNFMNC